MKTLIENSIEIKGIGGPEVKTIFNIEDESEKMNPKFKSLVKISGRTLTVLFKYTQDGTEVRDKLPLIVIKSDSENEIKDFILSKIEDYLKN